MEFEKTNQAFLLNIAGAPAVTINSDLKNNRSVAKVGVNYKFDWGAPVAARYFIWQASQDPGPQAGIFFAGKRLPCAMQFSASLLDVGDHLLEHPVAGEVGADPHRHQAQEEPHP
jgi:hypothetical protein